MIKIITHNGAAHLDEVAAIAALIVAKNWQMTDISIARVHPAKTAEYDTGNEYFVDCGMRYDGQHYYDHHQKEDIVAGKAAFNLVVDSHKEMEFLKEHPLYQRIALQDNLGLAVYHDKIKLKISRREYAFDLLEDLLIKRFAKNGDKTVIELFCQLFLEYRKLEEIKKETPISVTEYGKFRCLVVDNAPGADFDCDDLAEDRNCDIIVKNEYRDGVKRLFLLAVNPKINFNLIDFGESVSFIHKGGKMLYLHYPVDLRKFFVKAYYE